MTVVYLKRVIFIVFFFIRSLFVKNVFNAFLIFVFLNFLFTFWFLIHISFKSIINYWLVLFSNIIAHYSQVASAFLFWFFLTFLVNFRLRRLIIIIIKLLKSLSKVFSDWLHFLQSLKQVIFLLRLLIIGLKIIRRWGKIILMIALIKGIISFYIFGTTLKTLRSWFFFTWFTFWTWILFKITRSIALLKRVLFFQFITTFIFACAFTWFIISFSEIFNKRNLLWFLHKLRIGVLLLFWFWISIIRFGFWGFAKS